MEVKEKFSDSDVSDVVVKKGVIVGSGLDLIPDAAKTPYPSIRFSDVPDLWNI
jgi:hypothetical protein